MQTTQTDLAWITDAKDEEEVMEYVRRRASLWISFLKGPAG